MLTSAQFGDLLKNFQPVLRKIHGDTYNDYQKEYAMVFSVQSSTGYQERDHSISGFGLVPEKPKGSAISYDEANDGYNTTYVHTTYGLGFQVERELFEDDNYRKIIQMPKALARSNVQTEETLAWNHFNRAFNSSYTGGDGKELCATDHPIYGRGGTWANELATAADLDETSFEQALIDIAAIVSDDGLKIAVKGRKLVVPTALDWQSKKLLKSGQEPSTANNAIHPGMNILPQGSMTSHWLTDPDAWFITTDITETGLLWFWRRKPEFTRDNDFNTENARFKTTWRASSGWSDPRCIFGSPGA